MESVSKTGNVPDAQTMDYISGMSKAVTKTLMNQSYLGSFLRMAGALGRSDVGGALGQVGGGYVDRFVPASGLLNQVEQAFDQNLREADPSRPWEREASRIPGLSRFLPYKISPTTGEPAVRPRGGPLGVLLRAETEASDPLKAELARLDRLNFDVPPYKDYPDTVSFGGQEIRLRPEEQRAVTQQLGRARASLAGVVASPSYQAGSDQAKAIILKHELAKIDEVKLAAWLNIVDPADAQDRLRKSTKIAGQLVGAGR
jgi:hypothetical protein